MGKYDDLIWKTIEKEQILHTPVFDVYLQKEVTASGMEGDYVGISAPDWVVVIPVHEGNFVLVRQWRHGEDNLTLEFPGGVVAEYNLFCYTTDCACQGNHPAFQLFLFAPTSPGSSELLPAPVVFCVLRPLDYSDTPSVALHQQPDSNP